MIKRGVILLCAVGLLVGASGCSGASEAAAPKATSTTKAGVAVAEPEYPVATNVDVPGSPTFARIKAAGKVVIGIRADQPGIAMRDASTGQYAGFDVETARIVAAGLGLSPDQIDFRETSAEERVNALTSQSVDLVVSTFTITDKRKEKVDFAGPYYVTGQDLLVRNGDKDITGPESLVGKKACTVPGSAPAEVMQQQYPQVQLVTMENYSKCVAALMAGDVDAVTTLDVILRGFAVQAPDSLHIVGAPFTHDVLGVGLPKGDDALRLKLDDVLDQALADGTWQKAYDYTLGGAGTAPEKPVVDRY